MTKTQIELLYRAVFNLAVANKKGNKLDDLIHATENFMTLRLGHGVSFEIKISLSPILSKTCSKTFGNGGGAVGFIHAYPGGGATKKCGVIIKYSEETQSGEPINDLQKWIIILHEVAHTLLHFTFHYKKRVDKGNLGDPLRETEASYFAKYAICNNEVLAYKEKKVVATILMMHSPRKPYLEADLPA
ncbi:MAG: hypothetical protein FWG91_10990 [Lachnospiraceae bacterium]|nr:hypothetical protein [Lachnospiraceae bacterium]